MNNIEEKFNKSIKAFGLIILMICFGLIPYIIFNCFGGDFRSLNSQTRTTINFINDLVLILLLIKINYSKIRKDLIDFKKNYKKILLTSLKYWLIGLGIMYFSNIIIYLITNGQISANEQSVRDEILKHPLYMFFETAIYAPFTEEIIFRKSIKDIKLPKYIYIFVSGFIFGALHILLSGSTSITNYLYLIPYCSVGFAFATLYYKTDNIFSTISMHSIHNLTSFLIFILGEIL